MQALPLIAQTFLNPAFMGELNKMGMTFDLQEFSQMVLDATGYKSRGQFVRPLTDEEKQAIQEASQKEQNVELVKQRERMAALGEMQDKKAESDLLQALAERGMDQALEEPNVK